MDIKQVNTSLGVGVYFLVIEDCREDEMTQPSPDSVSDGLPSSNTSTGIGTLH